MTRSSWWVATKSSRRSAGGRTEVLTVSDAARTIVLLHEEKELSRQALALQPHGVTEIRF